MRAEGDSVHAFILGRNRYVLDRKSRLLYNKYVQRGKSEIGFALFFEMCYTIHKL